jgi:NAD(P)-dependent dehydrogenase (short-subunit alcohol dehydrogenase family)
MIMNETVQKMVEANDPALNAMQNLLPVPILQPDDIAGAVAWLVSDEAKYLTGVSLPVDAGFAVR